MNTAKKSMWVMPLIAVAVAQAHQPTISDGSARDAAGAVAGTVTYVQPETSWAEVSRPGEAEFRMLAGAEPADLHQLQIEPAHPGRGQRFQRRGVRHVDAVDDTRARRCQSVTAPAADRDHFLAPRQAIGFVVPRRVAE